MALCSDSDTGSSRIVETRLGPVTGVAVDGVRRFLGVPFAASPTENCRFMPPEPVEAWDAPLEAVGWSAPPMQHPSIPAVVAPDAPPPSEDCLYLNLWTPENAKDCPVFVWIHGGANVAGSNSMPVFDGASFARRGIVCVVATYRVGAFGFLELSGVLGPNYEGSSLNGLRDIAAAVAWVRSHVAAFGGSADRIVLGGQSAGAKNIAALLASNLLDGPVHGAILQSGGGQTVSDRDQAMALARRFADEAGIASDDRVKAQDLDARVLLAAQERIVAAYPHKFPFRPMVDGKALPRVPLRAFEQGLCRDVPMLCGTTLHESPVGSPRQPRNGDVEQQQLANMPLSRFLQKYAGYVDAIDEPWDERRKYRALAAEEYGIPTLRLAEANAAAGGAVWHYRFDMPTEGGPNHGLCRHGSELALTWNRLEDPLSNHLGPVGAEAAALGQVMHRTWCAFIIGGSPEAEGIDWPRFTPESRDTMRFASRSEIVRDIDARERALWNDWPGRSDLGVNDGL